MHGRHKEPGDSSPEIQGDWQHRIPCRCSKFRHVRVHASLSSFEDAGPFGAKSIGEVVINTPLPAVTDALSHAAGKRFYELPITCLLYTSRCV